ncbi:hypothetical protein BDZ97DRAFT_1752578 [Flammula alnicola]|nr:hypothetical protein BDZ97DRAFT_1752578 [Flammula alnicola]
MPPTSHIAIFPPDQIAEIVSRAYNLTVVAHPYIYGFLLMMWSYHPDAPFKAIGYLTWTLPKRIFVGFLRCLGFGEEGIEPDSYASRYQSTHYGSFIPEDSLFARYQSYGAVPGYSERDDIHHEEAPEPGIWWKMFGWGLYISGLSAMLVYGPRKA